MIDYCDTNIHFKFRLTRGDGTEVKPLWKVLAALVDNGFRIRGGAVRDTAHDGSFAWGAAVYEERGIPTMAERDALRYAAMQRVVEELGEECTEPDHAPTAQLHETVCA